MYNFRCIAVCVFVFVAVIFYFVFFFFSFFFFFCLELETTVGQFFQRVYQRKIVRPNEKPPGHSVRREKFEAKLNFRPDDASVRP